MTPNTTLSVNDIKKMYPIGTRIKMIEMDDPYDPVPKGTTGEVTGVDDKGDVMVNWENGSKLNFIPGIDTVKIL